MTLSSWAFALSALSAAAAAAPPPEPSRQACDAPGIRDASALHRFLSMRAVEITDRAMQPGWEADPRLRELVAPFAPFDLGAGDVGRPLGSGVAAARALALEMNADSYRFLGWDYVPYPVDPCSLQKVQVDFIDTRDKAVSLVTFTFDAGRLVKAEGAHRSFESGLLHGPRGGP